MRACSTSTTSFTACSPCSIKRSGSLSFILSLQSLSCIWRKASRPILMPHPSSIFLVPTAVRFDGPLIFPDSGVDIEVETITTHNLLPAVTLDRGFEGIKNALGELKLRHAQCDRGVLVFKVAVPPGSKAFIMFCCQPKSAGVFPRFFLSNEFDESQSTKPLSLHIKRGVLGIGCAAYLSHQGSGGQQEELSIKRYLSKISNNSAFYGFLDANFDDKTFQIYKEEGSYFFILPEIELIEHEDISFLSATLAWDERTCSTTFAQAIFSLESVMEQVTANIPPYIERVHAGSIYSDLKDFGLKDEDAVKLVSIDSSAWAKLEPRGVIEMENVNQFQQFCFHLKPNVVVTRNMFNAIKGEKVVFQHCHNLSSLWASLIVEECCRLGFTYFCIAPGSRSSPLAIAAASHPLATCFSCYDERSLAFHAVGYARGSRKPAVVITTSGTAVSNLLPAVVEASQDCLPMILLTADRPPELQDVGANQAINQVNHFGGFVRYFFSLPVPSDKIPSRMVLTTLDVAAHRAMSPPYGPVHINCPFRDPLDDKEEPWMRSCLKGLEVWFSNFGPFTKYLQAMTLSEFDFNRCGIADVLKNIQNTDRRLLLIGALHSEDDIWASLLLAKCLNWPVVADILSGLRIRKLLPFAPIVNSKIMFLDHLDHALLSESFRSSFNFDVVIQLGSRVTSKRIAQMMEECYPYTYLLVENHPYRSDPSHLVTHRVESSVVAFVDNLLNQWPKCNNSMWNDDLQIVETMVSNVLAFQLNAEKSLNEPFVVGAACKVLSAGSALFIGNSMAIRDADMYGISWRNISNNVADALFPYELPCIPISVTGNRGASGIDGLISSSVGFAVGNNKRVLCIIGDVSFLHDTNGLAILRQRIPRKPMTLVIINNHGGAIFSFLPVAERTDSRILDQYFYTSHSTSIRNLCQSHGVQHVNVQTISELQSALLTSQKATYDTVIEVESCISSNSKFHSVLRESGRQATNLAWDVVSRYNAVPSLSSYCKIQNIEISHYRIELFAPLTNASNNVNGHYKEGYLLTLLLQDGSVGHGEVAPLNTLKETILEVGNQLKFLVHVLKETEIPLSIILLNGTYSSWLLNKLGISEHALYPSVRCGLEMAILNAIAMTLGTSFLNILHSHTASTDKHSSVKICALLDSVGSPRDVAHIADTLVNEGFSAIKLKVARRADPSIDAAVVNEVRNKIGRSVQLRVDANRKWSYNDALTFGSLVKDCDLQYIEEPVQCEEDIIRYHEESGMPVALDETIDNMQPNELSTLEKYIHPGIVALIIKPSVVGGFEKAALLAKWAHCHGKLAIISSSFESTLGLSCLTLFSNYVDIQRAASVNNACFYPHVAHGLGTYKWLKQDVSKIQYNVQRESSSGLISASINSTSHTLQSFHVNQNVLVRTYNDPNIRSYIVKASFKDLSCNFKVHELGEGNETIVFLHGFLGSGIDWLPIIKAISGSIRCVSIDLPGHGDSHTIPRHQKYSTETLSEVLNTLILNTFPGKTTVVGYSMGGRIALNMALNPSSKIICAVIISANPGLTDEGERKLRRAKDDSLAKNLVAYGAEKFMYDWYSGDLWSSLRRHPFFKDLVTRRASQSDVLELANALHCLSPGRQRPMWQHLRKCSSPILVINGENDAKFKSIGRKMLKELNHGKEGSEESIHELLEIPESGHAVHLENPLSLIAAISQFLRKHAYTR